jgi:hypothetical protein
MQAGTTLTPIRKHDQTFGLCSYFLPNPRSAIIRFAQHVDDMAVDASMVWIGCHLVASSVDKDWKDASSLVKKCGRVKCS